MVETSKQQCQLFIDGEYSGQHCSVEKAKDILRGLKGKKITRQVKRIDPRRSEKLTTLRTGWDRAEIKTPHGQMISHHTEGELV